MEPILRLEHIQKYYGNEEISQKPLRILVFLWNQVNFWELWEHPDQEKRPCSIVFLRLIQSAQAIYIWME